jgi:hypothetical protein
MQETMTGVPPRRGWWMVCAIGVTMIVLGLIVTALVIYDKKHFGWMVGGMFLPIMATNVILGGLLVVIGAWKLPQRKTWRGITLIVWGLIAATSPALGYMFLLPWAALALLSPVVIAALIGTSRS